MQNILKYLTSNTKLTETDPFEKDRLLGELLKLKDEIEALPLKRGCTTCLHWDGGCQLANKRIPPDSVYNSGCELWLNAYEIPFDE